MAKNSQHVPIVSIPYFWEILKYAGILLAMYLATQASLSDLKQGAALTNQKLDTVVGQVAKSNENYEKMSDKIAEHDVKFGTQDTRIASLERNRYSYVPMKGESAKITYNYEQKNEKIAPKEKESKDAKENSGFKRAN